MKTWHEILIALGLVSTLSVGGSVYIWNKHQQSLNRCEEILQEFTIQDRYFCDDACRINNLLELVEGYKLEDGALAYRLSQNRCGK